MKGYMILGYSTGLQLTRCLLLQSFVERLHNAYMYLDYTLHMYKDIRPLTLQLW